PEGAQLRVQSVAFVLVCWKFFEDALGDHALQVRVDLALYLGGDGVARKIVGGDLGMGFLERLQRPLRHGELVLDAHVTRRFAVSLSIAALSREPAASASSSWSVCASATYGSESDDG